MPNLSQANLSKQVQKEKNPEESLNQVELEPLSN